MIDFERVWLPQILQYAKLIGSGQLEAEWQRRAKATTSITDPDELHEQVFDDLDAERIWAENRHRTGLPAPATEAIDSFLAALRTIDESDAELVATSHAWVSTKEAAQAVVTILG